MKHLISALLLIFCGSLMSGTIYVNNVKGSDKNPGTRQAPVASIWRALNLVQKSGVIDVANTGKSYQTPYYGPFGRQMNVLKGGTAEKPLEIRGNGAVITGLSVIPAAKWSKTSDKNILSLPFWPMSNKYKGAKTNYWPDTSAQIWWVDGKAAPNCKNKETLLKTPGGFWWNKAEKKVLFHLPENKKLADLKIELPANSGFYIIAPYVIIRDFYCIFSWNDGFDTAGLGYDGIYRNCIALNNCGQGFSCHGTGSTLYEDCAAIGCNSSGSCDVDQSYSRYIRCIFYKNTYEAGIYSRNNSQHYYGSCIIAGNIPFEQLWSYDNSSMHFYNCLIEGTPGRDVLAFSGNAGTVSFRNCTITGGKSLFSLKNGGHSSAAFQNCIIGGTEKALFTAPKGTAGQLHLVNNVFFDIKSLVYDGKNITEKEFPHWVRSRKNDHSLLLAKKPEGILRINKRITGAHLPADIIKRFEKLKKLRANAAGIYFEK
ncbi:MAG: right-handed parallel beta-helix repeat-containing protein [Lentisphaeria bacterium]|nr:right-handed parallel beta-helix repeat-containing protein [Lentisphaeria bacterium]